MRYDPVQIITSGNMSLSSINSAGMDLSQYAIASIQAVWSGSPVGTIKLQISNDVVRDALGLDRAANVVNWSDYTASIQAVNGAGNFAWNMNFLGFRWVRLVYTKTSGSGTLNATFCGKG